MLTYRDAIAAVMAAAQDVGAGSWDVRHGPSPEVGLPDNCAYPLIWVEDNCRVSVTETDHRYSVAFLSLDRSLAEQPDETATLTNEVTTLAQAEQRGYAIINAIHRADRDLFDARSLSFNAISIHRDYADRVHGFRFELTLVSAFGYTCDLPPIEVEPLPPAQPISINGGNAQDVKNRES